MVFNFKNWFFCPYNQKLPFYDPLRDYVYITLFDFCKSSSACPYDLELTFMTLLLIVITQAVLHEAIQNINFAF